MDRASNARLAELLSSDYPVFNFDRRGRGDSGDTQPYAVEREIEDIAAMLDEAGAAILYGSSSGAALALMTAATDVPVTKLAYDARIMGDYSLPLALAASVRMPTLVLAGGADIPRVRETARALADALPRGQTRMLDGQAHDVDDAVLAPALKAFFQGET